MASIFILFGLLLLANAYFFMKVRKKRAEQSEEGK
jgi:hypothetical protein